MRIQFELVKPQTIFSRASEVSSKLIVPACLLLQNISLATRALSSSKKLASRRVCFIWGCSSKKFSNSVR